MVREDWRVSLLHVGPNAALPKGSRGGVSLTTTAETAFTKALKVYNSELFASTATPDVPIEAVLEGGRHDKIAAHHVANLALFSSG